MIGKVLLGLAGVAVVLMIVQGFLEALKEVTRGSGRD